MMEQLSLFKQVGESKAKQNFLLSLYSLICTKENFTLHVCLRLREQTEEERVHGLINTTSKDSQGNNFNKSLPNWILGFIDAEEEILNFCLKADERGSISLLRLL